MKSVMPQNEDFIRRLVDRLEHLSADSIYAHRASGLRGSLLRYLECFEAGHSLSIQEQDQLDGLVKNGFEILELAAKELRAKKDE